MKTVVSIVAGLGLLSGSLAYANDVCRVESGVETASLVELYTSEGCSSCPPADEFLRTLRRNAGSHATFIPLALHVTYWDQIGWKDSFAQKAFDTRQRALVNAGKGNVVYTPQFFVNGREQRNWRSDLTKDIGPGNATPALAKIRLSATPLANGALLIDAAAQATPQKGNPASSALASSALYIALSENDVVSHVKSGENSGATLHHDATVRSWIGPIMLVGGKAHVRRELALPTKWASGSLQVVAFVQHLDDGRVFQAVSTAQCGSSKAS